jgi:hypothetical protein
MPMGWAKYRIGGALLATLFLAACQDRGELRASTGVLHFGDVYVGTVAFQGMVVEATSDRPVTVTRYDLQGTDARAFDIHQPSTPPAVVVTRPLPSPILLSFNPGEARHYRGVTLTAATRARAADFPINLRGNGVWQKSDVFISIKQSTNPGNSALDFGQVEVDSNRDRDFVVLNSHTQPLTLRINWLVPNVTMSAPGGDTITVPAGAPGAPAEATVTFRYRPTAVGAVFAVVEIGDGRSFAGTVLKGEGIPARASAGGVSLQPQTISPGETISVNFSLSHPDGLQNVISATIEGLPPNIPGGSVRAVQLPSQQNVLTITPITVGPPAMDGIYPLKLVVKHRAAADLEIPLGNLTVRDTAAAFDSVVVRADSHRRCEEGLVRRTVEYRVTDNNGATDVVNPRIEEVQPPGAHPPLTPWPSIGLVPPRNDRQTSETATTELDFQCNAKAGNWALIVRIDEDDKTVVPPALSANFRDALRYRVDP